MKVHTLYTAKCLILTLLLVTLVGQETFSQSNRWKRMRYEVFGGVGATNFLGELGGADDAGGYIKDLELSMTRPCYTFGARYMLARKLAVQAGISHGWVRGDDKKAEDDFRNTRDLNFKSQILEFSTRLEYSVLTPKKGHRYNLRKVRGRAGFRFQFDVFLGVGAFYFNPKGYDSANEEWVKLRPLGTEGQNFMETRKPYSRVSMCFPTGVTVKYILNRKWNISLEYGIRPTLTDYIDDASLTYPDPELVALNADESDKELVKRLANPMEDEEKFNEEGGYKYLNQQRGNSKRDDLYMFMFVTVNYKLKTSRKGLPKFR